MTNRVNALEERLHRVDMMTQVVVDNTLRQVEKPGLHFDDAFANFSGKHSLYCLKKRSA